MYGGVESSKNSLSDAYKLGQSLNGGANSIISEGGGRDEVKIEVAWRRLAREECDVIFRTIIEPDTEVPVTVVHLSDNQIGPEQAQKLAAALEASTVREALLCFNDIGKDGCDALANVVNVSVKLQLLDIRGNNLTPKCVRKLLKSISMSTSLTRLGLGSNKLGEEGAALLLRALEKNTHLTSLDISLNEIGPNGAKSIAQLLETPSSPLEKLQLYGNYLGCDGVVHITSALRRNRSLKELTLGNNNATDAAMSKVAEMLRDNITLSYLDLRLNTITASGARTLACDGLANNCFLQSLSLSGNPIGSVGAEQIFRALTGSQGPVLTRLDLSSCELGSVGGTRIADLITSSTTIEDVDLSDNQLDDDSAVALSRSLANGLSISALNLSSNKIGEWSASNLIDATQLNPRVMSLILHGNKINRVVQKKIDVLLEERLTRNRMRMQQTLSSHDHPGLENILNKR
ncbi:putative Leucine Rich repeat [Trypanosoma vivax]|nr:putative Leucine Rich repeat [Trypanosoma vivax]